MLKETLSLKISTAYKRNQMNTLEILSKYLIGLLGTSLIASNLLMPKSLRNVSKLSKVT